MRAPSGVNILYVYLQAAEENRLCFRGATVQSLVDHIEQRVE